MSRARPLPLTSLLIPLAAAAQAQQAEQTEDEQTPLAMEQIIVTGTASPTRTKYESSVAISTFEERDLEREAPFSTADLMRAVPGFWVEATSGTTQGNVFARGIIQDGGYRYVGLMEDGIPIYPVYELSFYNPDQFVRVDRTLRRVEVVRGGTAPIFSQGAVGGSINFITKDPSTDEAEGDFGLTIGNFGLYRLDAYWGGPVGGDWALGVGGYYRVSDGIRDPGYRADEGGQLRAELVRELETGELEIYAKYLDDRSLFVVPIPLRGDPDDPQGVLPGIDPGEYSLHSKDLAAAGLPPSAAEVGLQGSDLEDGIHPQLFTGGIELDLELGDDLNLVERLRYTDGEVRFDGIFPGPAPVTGAEFAAERGVAPGFALLASGNPYDPAGLVQEHGHWVIDKEYDAIQNDVRLTFDRRQHSFTVGLYLADYEMADRWSLGNLLLMDVNDRPNRLALPGVTSPEGFTRYSTFNLIADYDATMKGLYLSDEWQLTEALRLDLGVRWDETDIDARISNGVPDVDFDGNPATTYDLASLAGTAFTESSHDFDDTAWSVGFNYELNGTHAIFGHYTESAKLPHFDDVRNNVLQKDSVTNIDIGYKNNFDNLGMFVTLFQTEFDNVPFNDILPDGTVLSRRAETLTRGVEIEGFYRPTDAFGLEFSVTAQEPEYENFTGAEIDNTGNQIRRIPEIMARIMPTYFLPNGRGEVYLRVEHFDDRYSNDENTIVLPAYTKVDLGVIYDVNDSLSVQLVADNLTDEVGLTEGNPRTDIGAGGVGELYLARPLFGRSYRVSADYRF